MREDGRLAIGAGTTSVRVCRVGSAGPGTLCHYGDEVATAPTPQRPQRHLGLLATTAVVVASMVGTGVFTTTGFLLADLRSGLWVLLVWLLGGVLAACGALSYGALARAIPESGGEYVFLSRTLHPAAGYLAGWISLTAGFCAPLASAAIAFGAYARPFLPPGLPPLVASLTILALASLLHMGSSRQGARVHTAVVACVLGLIVIMAVFGLAHAQPAGDAPAPRAPLPLADLAVSLVWVSFSYAGWNAGVYIAGEVRDPQTTLPRALLLGTTFTTFVYLLLNTAFVTAAPMSLLAGKLEVGTLAATHWGGPRLGTLVSGLVALALAASISALTFSGPRVLGRMAEDGYLPRLLAAPAAGAPPRAALVTMFLASASLATTATYEHLLTYIGVLLGLSNAATVVGLFRLKARQPDLRVWGWPLVPAVFLALVAWMLLFTVIRKPRESLIGGLTLLVGLGLHRFHSGRRSAQPPAH